ncbi:MAG: xanthine dehydrogenase small subunit [Bdellovibrionota bacterium]
MRNAVVFFLNGKRQEISGQMAGMMLADYLRYEKSLTGTKIVCAEGDCGACSVLRYFPYSKDPNFYSINSCITTVAQMDGSSLVTVDALAEENKLTPVQKAMKDCHGSQCGFCTPGFVVALTGLVEKKLSAGGATIGEQEAKNALTGNLCRCTGYQPIIDAATSIKITENSSVKKRFLLPAQQKELKAICGTGVFFKAPGFSFFAPTSAKEAAVYLRKNKDARLIGAATDLGVQHNKRKIRLQKLLSLHLIPGLYDTKKTGNKFKVGARVTLTELRLALKKDIPEFAHFLDLFASPQIKNVATLIGNIGNASPIADTPPFLLAMNAVLIIAGGASTRKLALEDFYLGYRKTALKAGEFLLGAEFQIPEKNASFGLYKASQRKDLDISAVNAAFLITWKDKVRGKAKEVRVALGGVAATPVRLPKTEAHLLREPAVSESFLAAAKILQSEIQPIADLRGSDSFRRIMAESFLEKFFREKVGGT